MTRSFFFLIRRLWFWWLGLFVLGLCSLDDGLSSSWQSTSTTITSTIPILSTPLFASAADVDNHDNSYNHHNSHNNHNSNNHCRLYMAPSTIPGHDAGWGVFAGIHFQPGDLVFEPDIIVPLLEVAWNNGYDYGPKPKRKRSQENKKEESDDDDDDDDEVKVPGLFNAYDWRADGFPGMHLDGEYTVSAIIHGYGSMVNCKSALVNIQHADDYEYFEDNQHQYDYDEHPFFINRVEIGREDPGAGAFTPYQHQGARATTNIPPGAELFVNYGDEYFDNWIKDKKYPVVARRQDFPLGVEIFNALGEKVLQRLGLLQGIPYGILIGLHEDTFNDATLPEVQAKKIDLVNDLLHVLHDFAQVWRSSPLESLPKNFRQLITVSQLGLDKRDLKQSRRSLDEIKQIGGGAGICLDRIRAGVSTLPHAGLGAFAADNVIAKGQIVAPVPLVHVPNRTLYGIREGHLVDVRRLRQPYRQRYRRQQTKERSKIGRQRRCSVPDKVIHAADMDGEPLHEQIMVNYCFGDEESTLLLCGYGAGVSLINHSKEKANVKLQWSQTLSLHPEWLEVPLSNWSHIEFVGLAMEIVALEDIAPGEEIFLDYGSTWENAWKKHVTSWRAPPESSWYRVANELNQDIDLVIRTKDEGGYGDFLNLYCFDHFRVAEGLEPSAGSDRHLCQVVDRRWTASKEHRYTVEVFQDEESVADGKSAGSSQNSYCKRHVVEILWDVPRDAFVFQDEVYSRDHVQPWSFRHHIGLPDGMFPDVWKNLKVT